jgi:hypothetical protein
MSFTPFARSWWRVSALIALLSLGGTAFAQVASTTDPRASLKAGWFDAAQAIKGLELVGHHNRTPGFINPGNPGDFGFASSDLAFSGNYVFQGSFNGMQVWDVSNPARPTLRTAFTCSGGQGDPTVYGKLLFMSVEETRGRVDCGTQGVQDTVSALRFRGVRIFDISNIDNPKQVAAVQTCRGSHTHTLVVDPKDKANVYIYVSGTSVVRSGNELAGCSGASPDKDPNTSLFRIEVIKVPLASPQDAKVIATPRIFADSTGQVAGLWRGGPHGPGTQTTSETNQCHDITVYSAIGLALGACSGNGLLIDISDPGNPRRITEVIDENFAYWHSATFSNDGSKVIFTDEWGGGTLPRCRVTDRLTWGADAIFTLKNRKLTAAGYYKLPVAQTDAENCVAHNGSLIPVPGRDIFVQGWYQGGISIVDFTDPAHATEIAYFDRGPIDAKQLYLGGHWSAYWYNGHIYGAEIARGLDILQLKPSDMLSQNEIDAAKLVRFEQYNVQNQQRNVWPAAFPVARSFLDQLVRGNGIAKGRATAIATALTAAEKQSGAQRKAALNDLATQLDRDAASAADGGKVKVLAGVVRDMANASK